MSFLVYFVQGAAPGQWAFVGPATPNTPSVNRTDSTRSRCGLQVTWVNEKDDVVERVVECPRRDWLTDCRLHHRQRATVPANEYANPFRAAASALHHRRIRRRAALSLSSQPASQPRRRTTEVWTTRRARFHY